MSQSLDKPLDPSAFANPADLLEEVRARRRAVEAAILETARNYERDFPDWKRGVLVRLLTETLEVLRDICEEGEEEAVSYDSPAVEVLRPVEWDQLNDRVAAIRLSDDDLHRPEALVAAFVARCNVLALSEATGGLAAAEHRGKIAPYKVPDAVRAILEQVPEEAREKRLEDAIQRPFRAGGFLEPVFLDLGSSASIPSREILQLEEDLTALPEMVVPRTIAPDSPVVGVTFSVWPVVVRPWSDEEPRAFFPIQVSLKPAPETLPLSAWTPEERADWWRRLLDGLREVSLRLSGSATYRERTPERTPEPAPPPPERRSSMAPVPMPRAAARSAAAYDFSRGLGRMFSGLRKIPNLDFRDEVACEEAERLFWEIATAHLDEAVAAGKLASWTKPEGTPGELVLHGLDEKGARALWAAIQQATLKGKGGPGLVVADPGFKSYNRFEGGEVVVETRLLLWPEASLVLKTTDRRVEPVRFHSEAAPGYVALLERHGSKPFSADGWVWIPRGEVREGFRIGGLPELLFPEGRAAIERMKKADAAHYERRLAEIFVNPILFRDEEEHIRRALEVAIQRARATVEQLSAYESGSDLVLCIFEAYQRQKVDWYNERVRLPDGRVIETRPSRALCLDPADLRLRLDPRARWGRNWRARIKETLAALTTLQRQTRTKQGKRVDVGDQFIRRLIDGREAVSLAETREGAGDLVRALADAGALPIDCFFVEFSKDFMEKLFVWSTDEKGAIHWGLDAVRAAKRKAEASGASLAEIREKTRQKREEVRNRPYFDHSPRLLSFGNAEEWPAARKRLAQALREEETPNVETYRDRQGTTRRRLVPNRLGGKRRLERRDGRDFVVCAGSLGRGYTVDGWLRKVEYARRPGKGGSRAAVESFADDLEALARSIELRVELEAPDRGTLAGDEAISTLRAFAQNATEALRFRLALLIPANIEQLLDERLRSYGILEDTGTGEASRVLASQGLLSAADIRVARMRAGLTQGELAARIGVSRAALGTWENATKPIPQDRQETLRAFVDEVTRTHRNGSSGT